jgi:hypothetical protein
MKISARFVFIALVFAVISFLLGPVLWQPSGDIVPSGSQMPFFLLLSALESVAFGLGISFILFAFPYVRRAPRDMRRTATVLYVVIAWHLVSWWPHDNMHISNTMGNVWGLIRIEYLFHFSLIITTIVAAYEIFQILKRDAGLGRG